jgi:ubiquinol-cytochrome c reductase subunit 6
MEICEPMCHFWKDKLLRCENKLEKIIKINPTKSCLYPMSDYVTCVEPCVIY